MNDEKEANVNRAPLNAGLCVEACLHWSLDVECPKCKEEIDLSNEDVDNVVSNAIFANRWGALKGHEITCPKCGTEFLIGEVVY